MEAHHLISMKPGVKVVRRSLGNGQSALERSSFRSVPDMVLLISDSVTLVLFYDFVLLALGGIQMTYVLFAPCEEP